MDVEATSGMGLEAMLQTMPELRSCCANMVDESAEGYTMGTKLMRLVSRRCRDVMTGEVHGYCLKICTHLVASDWLFIKPALYPLREWTFLRKVHLLRLTVEVQEPAFAFEGRMV